jgi:hypothetical protein
LLNQKKKKKKALIIIKVPLIFSLNHFFDARADIRDSFLLLFGGMENITISF